MKSLLDALYASGPAAVARPSRRAGRERRRDTPLRRARTCNLAGVELLAMMHKRGWILAGATTHAPGYTLTASGARALSRRGVDIEAARGARRQFASACLDWTERQPHLGGALGAKVLAALRAGDYVRPRPGGRDLRIVKPLKSGLAG